MRRQILSIYIKKFDSLLPETIRLENKSRQCEKKMDNVNLQSRCFSIIILLIS